MSYPCKICDPIHGFIRFGELEQRVIDSRPFQRLRYIHQTAVAYLVYPGANHSRFEHSLGVMELATRIYNALTAQHQFSSLEIREDFDYWRLILRLAALCHDMGHLPFSHTAEKSLLPEGGHEKMTLQIIYSSELQQIWNTISSSAAEDIAKLSVNEGQNLTPWEKALAKIITEDSFGADRMDYLIRDGRYTGVGYGYFDYHQLIDCLRLLRKQNGLSLGITASGIQSVESLLISRYMMYARVYHHPKACIYTHHMHRFLRRLFSEGISKHLEDYLKQTDYTVLSAMALHAEEGDYDARCLFKLEKPYREVTVAENQLKTLRHALLETFGDAIFIDEHILKEKRPSFEVLTEEGKSVPCSEASSFMKTIPHGSKPISLYAHPQKEAAVRAWLNRYGSC